MSVIANTTVISNFASVQRLDLLQQVLKRLYVSTEVYAEIQDGKNEGIEYYAGIEANIYPFVADGWLHLTTLHGEDELRLFNRLPASLHRGEASSLAIASARGWVFLTDDSRARKEARVLSVAISGTLGLLIQAMKRSVVTDFEADDLLQRMIAMGYRSPYGTIRELL